MDAADDVTIGVEVAGACGAHDATVYAERVFGAL